VRLNKGDAALDRDLEQSGGERVSPFVEPATRNRGTFEQDTIE
jgi:hypothetical protein